MAASTRLKTVRQRHGLQQREVAGLLGVSEQYYCEVENGRRPSFKLALKLAQLFGVSIDDLFGGREFGNSPTNGHQDTGVQLP